MWGELTLKTGPTYLGKTYLECVWYVLFLLFMWRCSCHAAYTSILQYIEVKYMHQVFNYLLVSTCRNVFRISSISRRTYLSIYSKMLHMPVWLRNWTLSVPRPNYWVRNTSGSNIPGHYAATTGDLNVFQPCLGCTENFPTGVRRGVSAVEHCCRIKRSNVCIMTSAAA